MFPFTQVSHHLFGPTLSSKTEFPFIYRAVPIEKYQYIGIVKLLKHFRWMWVGIVTLDDDKGEDFIRTLMPKLSENNICAAFIDRMPRVMDFSDLHDVYLRTEKLVHLFTDSQAKTLIVHAETHCILGFKYLLVQMGNVSEALGRVWVLTAQWDFPALQFHRTWNTQIFHGALSFAVYTSKVEGFKNFLLTLNPYSRSRYSFNKDFWEQAFDCLLPTSSIGEGSHTLCTGEEHLQSLPGPFFEMSMTSQSYSVYNAVYGVVHALHAMHSFNSKNRSAKRDLNPQPWQVLHFLANKAVLQANM